MKLISILFPAIIISGLLIVGCRHNNRDSAETFQNSVAGFDIEAAKKIIEEKRAAGFHQENTADEEQDIDELLLDVEKFQTR